ncbi:MAG: hypothetical protein B9S34_09625 [Opitutia bacterium Tous-C1TDCM]|nr:MAG: hypothetical protein B9S34_09625 [Opitutae bacterium Tous-C1TDCM]
MHHPIITKVAWKLLPAAITCGSFSHIGCAGSEFGLAGFRLQPAPILGDAVLGSGASLSEVGCVIFGVPGNLLAPGLRAQEGCA